MSSGSDLPNIVAFQPFDTLPVGPYNLVKSPSVVEMGIPTIEEAVAEFARIAVPAINTRIAYVGDHYGVVVVGYYTQDNSAPDWLGLKVGFDLLYAQPCVEQLEILMAEMQARERVA